MTRRIPFSTRQTREIITIHSKKLTLLSLNGEEKSSPPPNSPIKATGRKRTEKDHFGSIAKNPQAPSKHLKFKAQTGSNSFFT